MKYKRYCSHDWSENSIVLMNSLPRDQPLLVKPAHPNLNLEKLRKTIETGQKDGFLNADDVSQWNSFIESEEENLRSYDSLMHLEGEGDELFKARVYLING